MGSSLCQPVWTPRSIDLWAIAPSSHRCFGLKSRLPSESTQFCQHEDLAAGIMGRTRVSGKTDTLEPTAAEPEGNRVRREQEPRPTWHWTGLLFLFATGYHHPHREDSAELLRAEATAKRGRQHIGVCRGELVTQRPDLLGRQGRARVGIDEHGLAHELGVAGSGGFDGEARD
jgi:hypothetical protein